MPFSLKRKNEKVIIILLQNYKSPGRTPESSISWEKKPEARREVEARRKEAVLSSP